MIGKATTRRVAPKAPASAPGPLTFGGSILAIAWLSTALLFSLGVREGFVPTPRAILVVIVPVGLMAGLTAFCQSVRNEPVAAHIFWALGVMTFFSNVDAWLAIVGLAAGFPLQDARLMGVSRAIGIDYNVILEMVAQHETFGVILVKTYGLSVPMMFIAPVILSVTGQFERLKTFVRLYVVLLTACVAISMFVPAEGFALFEPLSPDLTARLPPGAGVYYAELWGAYRSGALRVMDPAYLEGVAVFPSFHTTMALLAIYAYWRTRFLWLASFVLNAVVLLSIVPIGGHYILDMVFSASMFLLALAFSRGSDRSALRNLALDGGAGQPVVAALAEGANSRM
ncbi:MAG: phosphatase PAP2 family protein [Xanthobacteraceae bacterium]